MKNINFKSLAIFACCLVALISNAQADTRGESAVSGGMKMKAVLFDLDPSDGIAPEILNVKRAYGNSTIRVNQQWPDAQLANESVDLASASRPVVQESWQGEGWWVGAQSAQGGADPFNLSELSIQGRVAPTKVAGLDFSVFDGMTVNFELSAHTALVVFADVSIAVSVNEMGEWNPSRSGGASATVAYSMGLSSGDRFSSVGSSGYSFSHGSVEATTCRFDAQHGMCLDTGKYSDAFSRQASVSLVNDGESALASSFNLSLYGVGQAYALAVPEPDALLMICAGLGFVLRRRQRS